MNIPFTIESDNTLGIEDLLPSIPHHIILKSLEKKALTSDEVDLIQKIDMAVENTLAPLPLGIAAIGELLAISSEEVDSSIVKNIGWLIESLGRQVFAFSHLKEMSEHTISCDKGIKSGNGGLMS